jgi:hypothetical protein
VVFNRFNTAYGAAQKKMQKLGERVYDNRLADGTKDQSGYREQFLHVANLFVTFGVWWVVAHFASVVSTSLIWYLVASITLPYISYTLVGKTMLDTKYGVGFVSFVLGLLGAAFAGIAVWTIGPALELKVAAAFASAFVMAGWMGMVFPVSFAALRKLTEKWTIGWVGPGLAFAFAVLFSPMGWLYDRVVDALSWLAEKLRPVWERIAAAFSGIRRAYDRILQALRGRA